MGIEEGTFWDEYWVLYGNQFDNKFHILKKKNKQISVIASPLVFQIPTMDFSIPFYSFSKHIIKPLLCTRHHARHWRHNRHNSGKISKPPPSWGLRFSGRDRLCGDTELCGPIENHGRFSTVREVCPGEVLRRGLKET